MQETTFHSNGQWEIVYCWHLNTIFNSISCMVHSVEYLPLFVYCKSAKVKFYRKFGAWNDKKKKKKCFKWKAMYEQSLNILAEILLNILIRDTYRVHRNGTAVYSLPYNKHISDVERFHLNWPVALSQAASISFCTCSMHKIEFNFKNNDILLHFLIVKQREMECQTIL